MSKNSIRIPETLYRSATFDRSAINEEARTVELSISSDAPYLRYFGNEILDHGEKSIDLSRMKAGAPLLFNHDRNAHIGRIIECKSDGKCLRVVAKFGNSALAQEKFQDVKDGILRETSVGYQVNRMVLEEEDDTNGDTYRVTSWTPYEGSLVTIPADPSVGVGRSVDNQTEKEISLEIKNPVDIDSQHTLNKPKQTKAMAEPTEPTAPKIDVVAERNTAISEFKARCKKIDDFVGAIKNESWRNAAALVANKHKDGEADFDSFRAEALNAFDSAKPVTASDPNTGLSQKEIKRFSLMNAARQIIAGGRLEGFEKECSEATAKHLKRTALREGTIFVPNEVAEYDNRRDLSTRAQNVTTATAGGFTVANQYGPMIELLNNATVLGKLGITIMDGLVGDLILPQQTGGATAYWVSETGALSDSQATFAQKVMTPHRCGATIPFTTQFLAQSSLSAEAFLRSELMLRLALLVDLAGLHGTGNSGQPLGVQNTTGINATVTYGGAATWADVVEHETGIAVDNADIGTMGFALSAATVGKWKTILKDSVAGAGYLISDSGTANGYTVARTNQISGNVSFFGVWSQFLHARWAGMEFIVDPYTLKKSGQVEITVNQLVDNLVRQPLAFNVSTDSAAQ